MAVVEGCESTPCCNSGSMDDFANAHKEDAQKVREEAAGPWSLTNAQKWQPSPCPWWEIKSFLFVFYKMPIGNAVGTQNPLSRSSIKNIPAANCFRSSQPSPRMSTNSHISLRFLSPMRLPCHMSIADSKAT